MSPKNLVPPLNYIALKVISSKIIHALADDEGLNDDAVENYILGATYEVVQDLLKHILNSIHLDASTRFSCLQVLLREDVKKLDTGIFPNSYYDKILQTICAKGKRLQHLNLKGVWVRDYPDSLCQLIKSLKCLRVLIIPHIVNDAVIEAIVQCADISFLDICGEACYSAAGIMKLKSDNIRILDIGNFGKLDLCQQESSGPELIADLIQSLPNLTSIRTYSFTGQAILILQNKERTIKTKLTYLHDTGTNLDVIGAILNLCPNLESIHVAKPEPGVIEKLVCIKKLNCLKLTRPIAAELMYLLRMSGPQLQVLKLNHNKNCSLDLSEICVNAPNLQTLECFQMKLTFSQLDTFFMCLSNVEILYCEVSDFVIKLFLSNSPFLKRIVVGCVINMTDGDLFRLCAECDFINLEELWFSCARALTSTSVELLMGHCPNLKVIGQLTGWDVHQEELDYLRTIIASSNTDLTLLPVGNFP